MTKEPCIVPVERAVSEYAAQIAAAVPTPGGGSVAATVGAFAAALAEMVCAITLQGKHPPAEPLNLARVGSNAAALRAQLLQLATADETAYAGYRAAMSLPRDTEAHKDVRQQALESALRQAADVPLTTAESSFSVLEVLADAAQEGTKHALSDIASGALLAQAVVLSALLNVRTNADLMKDAAEANRYRAQADRLSLDANRLTNEILQIISHRN